MLLSRPLLLVLLGAALADPAAAQCERDRIAQVPGEDDFGSSVALRGDWGVIGAFQNLGNVHVVRYDDRGTVDESDDGWVFHESLVHPSNSSNEQFGRSAALTTDFAYFGSTVISAGGPMYVRVYRRADSGTPNDPSDDTWGMHTSLVPSLAKTSVRDNLAADEQHLVVPEPAAGFHGTGLAVVFSRDDKGTASTADDAWVEAPPLVPSAPKVDGAFGYSVDVANDTVAVGAPGSTSQIGVFGEAYVYVRSDGGTPNDLHDDTWVERAKLDPPGASSQFGHTVATDGDWVAVGARWDSTLITLSGAVYLYRRDDAGTPGDPLDDAWSFHQALYPQDAAQQDYFGESVALDADGLVVGADRARAAYWFVRDDGGTPGDPSDDVWSESARMTASVPQPFSYFGEEIAVDAGRILVGAPHGGPTGDGEVFAYDLRSSLCSSSSTISASLGGSQPMNFHAGGANGSSLYWIFGSASGTSPGVVFPSGQVLPLVVDPYFLLTLNKPFAAVFQGFLGILSASGDGTAALALPPGLDPSLIGVELHHALTVAETLGTVDFASNAVSVTLVP